MGKVLWHIPCYLEMTKIILYYPNIVCACLVTSQPSTHNSHIHLGNTSETDHDLDHALIILCSICKILLSLVKEVDISREPQPLNNAMPPY